MIAERVAEGRIERQGNLAGFVVEGRGRIVDVDYNPDNLCTGDGFGREFTRHEGDAFSGLTGNGCYRRVIRTQRQRRVYACRDKRRARCQDGMNVEKSVTGRFAHRGTEGNDRKRFKDGEREYGRSVGECIGNGRAEDCRRA